MKVIFLDFDGVITNYESRYNLNAKKMEIIKHICDVTDAKIVITSSWRFATLEDTMISITDTSKDPNLTPFFPAERVIGVTDRMRAIKNGNTDKLFRVPRGTEIKEWLNEHKDVDKYVIIDDDTDMLLEQADFFVRTDGVEGITEKDAEKVIQILNG